MTRVLILGGTREAAALCAALAAQGAQVTLSLKGLTRLPHVPAGVRVVSGGFGGSAGLAAHLQDQRIAWLIDASHPFAATLSWNAFHASQLSNVPLVGLVRPAWRACPGDRWQPIASLAKAVAQLRHASPRRVLLALGGQGAAPFRACPQHAFQARVLATSLTALATSSAYRWRGVQVVRARGARTLAEEMDAIRAFAPDLMIVRNAGGPADAKLHAARRLKLPVWMINRPAMPPVVSYGSPAVLLAALSRGTGLL